MAAKRSSFWNGFIRNSTAPAFMAREVMGTSPCAVIKMMGIVIPARASDSWKSRPLAPGSRMSSTRQLGVAGRTALRKPSVEAKVCASNPTDSRRLLTASRTEASSSTTKIVGRGSDRGRSDMGLLRANGEGKLENSSATRTRTGPQPSLVRFNDRAADGKSHADAARLSGEEGLKDLFDGVRIDAGTGVFDGDQNLSAVLLLRADHQFFRFRVAHCVHAIQHEIHDYLLQLHPVGHDTRQRRRQLRAHGDLPRVRLAAQEYDQFLNDRVEVGPILHRGLFVKHGANPAEHSAGAGAVADHALRGQARFFQIGRVGGEPLDRSLSIADKRGQRLADFMRDGGSELSH